MAVTLDSIISLCKRRGILFQSSEIYGGLAATFDYGPIGVELKRNVKNAWWKSVVQERDDMEGLDASILMHPKVWEASGHVSNFSDPMIDCKKCKFRFRADHYWVAEISQGGKEPKVVGPYEAGDEAAARTIAIDRAKVKNPDTVEMLVQPIGARSGKDGYQCPQCGGKELTEPREFNLMFRTTIGPVAEGGEVVYLRPETAQGIFVNFLNVQTTSRRKLPFGIAQIGKSFRNEVTTRSFIFRTLEFEQMEVEYFCRPNDATRAFEEWLDYRFGWYKRYGIRSENLRRRQHDKDELAHYAADCYDVEYQFPMGWRELEGIANRTDYDLKQHSKFSGKDLVYFDPETNEHVTPFVIEPSAGVDRSVLAFICDAYREEMVKDRQRVVLAIHPDLAPIKAAIMPLLRNRPELVEKAQALTRDLKKRWPATYDDTGQIGKLYRRQDEIGTPFCVTVDVESLEDGKATVRERDTMEQSRLEIERVGDYIDDRMKAVRESLA